MIASNPFAGMVASLQHGQALTPSLSDRAELLRMAAEHLRGGPPAVQPVADAFEQYLAAGGNIEKLLGLAVARGGANEVPHRIARRQTRDEHLRALASTMTGNLVERAQRIAQMLLERHPAAVAIHHEHGPVPSSTRHLVRILTTR